MFDFGKCAGVAILLLGAALLAGPATASAGPTMASARVTGPAGAAAGANAPLPASALAAASSAAVPTTPAAQAPSANGVAYEKIVLAGPTAVVSFPLLHMVETGALAHMAGKLEFRLWQNPDQLRVLLAKNEIDFTATPSNLPALMANRGAPVRLLNISVWGILWLVSSDPAVKGIDDLAGQTLLVPFQRDLPSVLLDTLLDARGLMGERAVTLRRTRDAKDAIALMLTGQGSNALLVEPTASLLLWRAGQAQGSQSAAPAAGPAPAPLRRVVSLEAAWREAFPGQGALPQAGIMANSHVAHDRALNEAVAKAYAESSAWCNANQDACAELVHRHLPQLPAPAVREALRVTRLDARLARDVRPQLEDLYGLLARKHPDALAGRLPEASFYGP